MTTICYDGKMLATDSKSSQGHIAMIGGFQKIYFPTEEEYWEIQGVKVLAFAVSGAPEGIPFVKESLNRGITHRSFIDWPDLSFAIIAVDENGQGWYWDVHRNDVKNIDSVSLMPVTGPMSAGSGMTIANAVMSIGADAKTAVEVACKLDNYSGGEIQVWVCPDKPETPSKRPEPVKEEGKLTPAEEQTRYDEAMGIVVSKITKDLQLRATAPVGPPATHPYVPQETAVEVPTLAE